MSVVFTVKRDRESVTQGYARVFMNDVMINSFGDNIVFVGRNGECFGLNIDGWGSIVSDEEFIKGAMYHPYDKVYHYSNRIKSQFDKIIGEKKEIIKVNL